MTITLHHVNEESEHIRTFFFTPEKPVSFTAGQYVELTLQHNHIDSRGDKRWFTLSSSPSDKFLSITTKFTDKEGSSFKKQLLKLPPGSKLDISSPQGDFVLPKLIQTPLIFVAGGVGITPFHSIATWLAHTKETRPIKMIYGVSSEDEIIFQDILKKAGIDLITVVGEPSDAWGGERGKITPELILGIEHPTEDSLFYLSGPKQMIENLKRGLEEAGVNHQQIITDSFPNYVEI